MRRMLATLIFALAGATLTMVPANATEDLPFTWTACEYEDQGTPCVWDARHMGNGKGSSFKVSKEGFWIKITHAKAHTLLQRGEFHRQVLTDGFGSWEECFWDGVRWNAPCGWDNRHSSGASLYPKSKSYIMYPGSGGQIQVDYLPHRIVHYLLGF